MARIANSMLGNLRGKVGNVVASKWKDVEFVRSKGAFRKDKASESQLAQRAKFKLALSFLRTISDLVKLSYKDFTSKMSWSNLAMAQIIQNAITGNFPAYALDYSKIKPTFNFSFADPGGSAQSTEPGRVSFTWENITGVGKMEAEDKAVMVVHCEEKGLSVYTLEGAPRSEETAILSVPFFKGKQVHTWLAFIKADGTISSSSYTGLVTVL